MIQRSLRRRQRCCGDDNAPFVEMVRPAQSLRQSLDALSHDGWQRFGHAWYDVITVRHSTRKGTVGASPPFSRFAGEVGGAYAGYPWYPGAENTLPK